MVLNDCVNDAENIINVYKMHGGELHHDKIMRVPCEHFPTMLLGLVINHYDLLAISCYHCEKIRLLNMETEHVTEACCNKWVGYMCHGEKGRLFASSLGGNVTELDCSSSRFTDKNMISIGLLYPYDLCYLPHPHDCLVAIGKKKSKEDPCEVRAVSCQDGEVVWRV